MKEPPNAPYFYVKKKKKKKQKNICKNVDQKLEREVYARG